MCDKKSCRNCPNYASPTWYGGGYCVSNVIDSTPTTKFGALWSILKNATLIVGIVSFFLFVPAVIYFFS